MIFVFNMKTYVILSTPDGTSTTLCDKRSVKKHLRIEPTLEIKHEFKAVSWEVARIVSDHLQGYIEDIDALVKGLANHFGYYQVRKRK